jgi:S-adenosyl-L-methionine hydrolase (adenosine-forming)
MGRRYDTISLLTDYGHADEFVGVVKSVIRDIAPHVVTIDLAHDLPAFDVRAGALALARCIPYVATGLVIAIVDPGVATDRVAVAIEVAGGEGVLLGPDNGLLAPAVALTGGAGRAVALTNPAYQLPAPGPTFAGRDVFAPAAAHLANGVDLAELGPALDPDLLRPGIVPLTRQEGDTVVGEVLWVDRFGNAQVNVDPDEIKGFGERVGLTIGGKRRVARRVEAFAALGPGELGLVVDSYGLLALCLDRASAADELGLAPGSEVRFAEPGGPDEGRASTPVAFVR